MKSSSISHAHNEQQQTLHLTSNDMETSKQDFHHDENSTLLATPPSSDNGATIAHSRDDDGAIQFFESTAVIPIRSSKTKEGMYQHLLAVFTMRLRHF
jgi:hypothetical protein